MAAEGGDKALVRKAVIGAAGFPSIVLFASMTGFGSLCRASDLSLAIALGATAGIWGLPGQLAMVELQLAGSELIAIVMAVSLANARFFPMALVILPLLRVGLTRKLWLFPMVQMMSLNPWAATLREAGRLSGRERRLYFVTFAAVCVTAALAGTAFGYLATGALPRPLTLGLIFLNPLFFALLFASLEGRSTVLALLLGAVVGPLLHLVSPDWGLMATGLLAGTAAFLLARRRGRP
ncbi:MAG: AzlC family ABC transporter permease [Pseudomonadota bacterium]